MLSGCFYCDTWQLNCCLSPLFRKCLFFKEETKWLNGPISEKYAIKLASFKHPLKQVYWEPFLNQQKHQKQNYVQASGTFHSSVSVWFHIITYCCVTNFSLLLVSLYSLQPSCLPSSAQCNIAWDYRQQTGPINWWKMFVFLSSVRWQVKSLFCCGRRSLAGPFCSEDRTVVHWYVFWPTLCSAVWCLT